MDTADPDHSRSLHKRKRHDSPHTNECTYHPLPPLKKSKINKRSSPKKRSVEEQTSATNSHVSITFANINGTIDAIVLPKQTVVALTDDALHQNKGKLSLKTSDPIQSELTPNVPIDIKVLLTPDIKTIHPRNSFRMGTSLFYCADEERLFWSFPLRNTRRVSCQHYCTSVEKIVTRSVGIFSNKCNGRHPSSSPCIYAVCNGKPPKGIIPSKLLGNYQYFQHSAKTDLLVQKHPNEKFKKIENTMDNSAMYQDIEIVADAAIPTVAVDMPVPPLEQRSGEALIVPQNTNTNSSTKLNLNSNSHNHNGHTPKRRRPPPTHKEPAPFVQNVQIDLKALSERRKQALTQSGGDDATAGDEEETNAESHDYSTLLLHSASSVLMDQDDAKTKLQQVVVLLLRSNFDDAIEQIQTRISASDQQQNNGDAASKLSMQMCETNEYRLLMATALYYRDNDGDTSDALHYVNLAISQLQNSSDDNWGCYYEARRLRAMIHRKLNNFKAACFDFEFVAFGHPSPAYRTWHHDLYDVQRTLQSQAPSSHSPVVVREPVVVPASPLTIPHAVLQQVAWNAVQSNDAMRAIADAMLLHGRSSLMGTVPDMFVPSLVPPATSQNIKELSNPNAPIIFVPSALERDVNANCNAQQPQHNQNEEIDSSIFAANYSDLAPKGFPERVNSGGSFQGLLALAHAASSECEHRCAVKREADEGEEAGKEGSAQELVPNAEDMLKELHAIQQTMQRKTTREELLEHSNTHTSLANLLSMNTLQQHTNIMDGRGAAASLFIPPMLMNRTISKTPEPLDRLRSDCLANDE